MSKATHSNLEVWHRSSSDSRILRIQRPPKDYSQRNKSQFLLPRALVTKSNTTMNRIKGWIGSRRNASVVNEPAPPIAPTLSEPTVGYTSFRSSLQTLSMEQQHESEPPSVHPFHGALPPPPPPPGPPPSRQRRHSGTTKKPKEPQGTPPPSLSSSSSSASLISAP